VARRFTSGDGEARASISRCRRSINAAESRQTMRSIQPGQIERRDSGDLAKAGQDRMGIIPHWRAAFPAAAEVTWRAR
jgi:hypothetical protein